MEENGPQRRVAGRYALDELLGQGGMGTVWRATDTLLERQVAVKELRLDGEESGRQVERALREARTIARLSHPNVVEIYDLLDHEDRLWIVMELVEGSSLAQRLRTEGPLPLRRVVEVGLRLLGALEAVHAAGALHRDVKPGNILLRDDGTPVLCDFGIAALVDGEALTTAGAVIGSTEFIAPERLRGEPGDASSDLFALGVTLCALLSGRSPFARSSPAAVMHAVAHEKPHIPASAGPLRPLLTRLLHKNPRARPSAIEVADALRAAADLSAPTPGDSATLRLVPATFRGRRRTWGVVLAALLLVGGATGGWMLMSSTGQSQGDGQASQSPSPQDRSPAETVRPVTDAVMRAPGGANHYWRFSGDRYTALKAGKGKHERKVVDGPAPLSDWSDSFGDLEGFRDGIDAVMRTPDKEYTQYWVFSGGQYVRIKLENQDYDDKVRFGPTPLSSWSGSFGDLAGFRDGIDAVMQTPYDRTEYWVFSGNQYVRIDVDATEKYPDELQRGPLPLSSWSGSFGDLAGFRDGIDAVMQTPYDRNEYWVFSGDQYVRIEVGADDVDRLLTGPHPMSDWFRRGR